MAKIFEMIFRAELIRLIGLKSMGPSGASVLGIRTILAQFKRSTFIEPL